MDFRLLRVFTAATLFINLTFSDSAFAKSLVDDDFEADLASALSAQVNEAKTMNDLLDRAPATKEEDKKQIDLWKERFGTQKSPNFKPNGKTITISFDAAKVDFEFDSAIEGKFILNGHPIKVSRYKTLTENVKLIERTMGLPASKKSAMIYGLVVPEAHAFLPLIPIAAGITALGVAGIAYAKLGDKNYSEMVRVKDMIGNHFGDTAVIEDMSCKKKTFKIKKADSEEVVSFKSDKFPGNSKGIFEDDVAKCCRKDATKCETFLKAYYSGDDTKKAEAKKTEQTLKGGK
jgi:hypothetical protein